MTDEYLHSMFHANRELWAQPHIPFAYLKAAEKMFGFQLAIIYTEAYMRAAPGGVEVPVYGKGATFPDEIRSAPMDDDYMLVTHNDALPFAGGEI